MWSIFQYLSSNSQTSLQIVRVYVMSRTAHVCLPVYSVVCVYVCVFAHLSPFQ